MNNVRDARVIHAFNDWFTYWMNDVRDEWEIYVMNEDLRDEWVNYVILYCETFHSILTNCIVF
jgi:hypothetical protein